MRKLVGLGLLVLTILLTLVISYPPASFAADLIDRDALLQHDFETIDFTVESGNIIAYSNYRNNITKTTKVISFNTPKELYDFSQDASFYSNLSLAEKEILMNNNYTLGQDIDYSVMKSSRFIPIGYDFTKLGDGTSHKLKFKGVFDGRGFEIHNLYFAGYEDLIFEDEVEGLEIDTTLSFYHAMFNYNYGTISNLGLINPTIDLDYEHPDINNFANLVGENNGLIENVYVTENRSIQDGGMRVIATRTQSNILRKTASGIVHTNNNIFRNSYYTGRAVVNASYIHAIETEPLIFLNNNNDNPNTLVYDNTLYREEIILTNSTINVGTPIYGIGESTTNLYNASSVLDNNTWHYYPADRYPALWGLTYEDGVYQISDAKDFITFNRLQRLNTVKNGLAFRLSSYEVTENINFNDIAKDGYVPSAVEFAGKFNGNNNKIMNFSLNKGTLIGTGYYLGLFAVVSGTIENVIMSNSNITPINYSSLYGQHFFIGNLVGRLDGGIIHNAYVEGNIDLGNENIGSFSIGGVVGEASGQVIKVYHEGNINLGSHNYTNEVINNKLNVGGIIGNSGSNKLILYNALNKANITTLSANNLNTSNNDQPKINVGGVIGFVENGFNRNHNLGLLTNEGIITIEDITDSSNVTIHLGGVIGYSSGASYDYNEFQGLFENKGNFIFNNTNSNIKAAGILISNHNVLITYTQIFNTNKITVNSSNITAATLVYSIGNSNININHAKSSGEYNFSVRNKNLSMMLHSEGDMGFNLNYINNQTWLNVDIAEIVNQETNFSIITLNEKSNFYNISNRGNANFHFRTINSPVWISGITKVLSQGYVIKDTINYSNINFAITSGSSQNIYVAGIANINNSGELHTQTNGDANDSSRPKTNTGIINTINNGSITTTIDNEINGIRGSSNAIVGGVVTLNSGSIQDVVNLGNISVVNLDTYNSSRVSIDNTELLGGQTNSFRSGVILGGIAATISDGNSRIYDTSNNGDVIGLSEHFVRVGGILGVSSLFEMNAGNINNNLYISINNANNSRYIPNSILSNGINYGNISAISKTIGQYNLTNRTWSQAMYVNSGNQDITPVLQGASLSMRSNTATVERIGVYSSAGGVIGYGLSKMYRMINHGEVSATDAAGGIVGSTYVYVQTQINGELLTVININTAINYGDIRAVRNANNNYNNIDKIDISYSNIRNQYYPINNTFVTPNRVNSNPDIRRHPQSKRGFGGIFGRIQRGGNQIMTSEGGSFDFIVNMNPNIDLIGRLDQNYNFSWSGTAFRFYDAIYYSAKEDDMTQAVFTGFEYNKTYTLSNTGNNRASITDRRFEYQYSTDLNNNPTYRSRYQDVTYTASSNAAARSISITERYHQIGQRSTLMNITYSLNSNQNNYTINTSSFSTWSDWILDSGGIKEESVVTINSSLTSNTNYNFLKVLDVPFITESNVFSDNKGYGYNVYSEGFVMRDENTTLTTGEPITSYIYYAENALLADRFKISRPNGMYVLSTSSGSNFGSVLPRNLNILNFRELKKAIPLDTNYQNMQNTDYYNPVELDLIMKYEELYQTMYNEKSELLEDDQVFEIKETNSGLLLQDPLIDFDSKTITFNLYADMVSNQTNLNFIITNALIPSNALITRLMYSGETNANYHNLITNYNNGNIASGNLAPNLLLSSKPSSSQTVSIGKFRSNSEALINDISFIDTYYTEYEIFINYIVNPISLPQYVAYQIDSATNWSTANLSNDRTITDKIGLRFRDTTQNIISPSFKIENFITLEYLNNDTYINVNNDYFSVSSTLKDNQRYFSAEVDFSEQLRNGLYRIGYKFYPDDEIKYVNIDYQKIINNRILNLRANTGTFYNEIPINNIHGDIKFGYDIPTGTYLLNSSNVIIDDNVAPYLNNKTYNLDFLEYFETSDFFDIESITITDSYNSETGYKTYQIDFDLINGNDVTINLLENNIEPIYYKDGVRIPTGTTDITREAEQTIIELDFNFLNNVSNNLTIDSFATTLDTIDHIDITYDDGRLRFAFNKELDPANYNTIIYLQYNNQQINVGSLNVEKQQGTSAYLSNIRFSAIAQETSYPDIYLSDETGNIINNPLYLPDVYFAGIDYAEADNNNIVNFRIDGQVSNIPLDDYTPLMTEYLPLGANIYRIAYDQEQNEYRTPILEANFTINPKTGLPPLDEEDIIITYVVVSEDEENEVFYHITVTDTDYNVTLVFNIYYETTNDGYIAVNDINSPLINDLIVISTTNYIVSNNEVEVEIGGEVISDVSLYPSFNKLEEIQTHANMFYVGSIPNLSYRLGRNKSGFYQFKLNLPEGYQYSIYIGASIDDLSIGNETWESSNQLRSLSNYLIGTNEKETGYYYYINGSTRLRTRYFTIVISDDDVNDSWGLTDKS